MVFLDRRVTPHSLADNRSDGLVLENDPSVVLGGKGSNLAQDVKEHERPRPRVSPTGYQRLQASSELSREVREAQVEWLRLLREHPVVGAVHVDSHLDLVVWRHTLSRLRLGAPAPRRNRGPGAATRFGQHKSGGVLETEPRLEVWRYRQKKRVAPWELACRWWACRIVQEAHHGRDAKARGAGGPTRAFAWVWYPRGFGIRVGLVSAWALDPFSTQNQFVFFLVQTPHLPLTLPPSSEMTLRETRAMLSVGGAYNEVLEEHPNMCHHCGFYAVPVTHRCERCGIQYHEGCGPSLAPDGLCDMCQGGGRAKFPSCYLCDVPDPAARVCGTDRLNLRLVYHGMHWRPATSDESAELDGDTVRLPSGCAVASRLRARGGSMFHFKELPHEGRHRMSVEVQGVGTFVSVPFVVHSWCAACLFDVDCSQDVDDYGNECDWRTRLVQKMFSCGSSPVGTMEQPVTRGGAACQFCGSDSGWLTYCSYHLSHKAGCTRCRADRDPTVSMHAFHPSCAVRFGMQRMVRQGRHGMFCARNKKWRGQKLQSLKYWLGMTSGINHDLLNLDRLIPSNLTDVPACDRKGSRYGDSMIPLSQRA